MVLPYINMNLPQVYTCSQSWTPLQSLSPYHPSGSSQCTSPKHPVSCIEPGLAISFLYNIIHVSMPFLTRDSYGQRSLAGYSPWVGGMGSGGSQSQTWLSDRAHKEKGGVRVRGRAISLLTTPPSPCTVHITRKNLRSFPSQHQPQKHWIWVFPCAEYQSLNAQNWTTISLDPEVNVLTLTDSHLLIFGELC